MQPVPRPEAFEREVYRTGTCFRSQVPLRLAWALTIHKAQGVALGCTPRGKQDPVRQYVMTHCTPILSDAFFDGLRWHKIKGGQKALGMGTCFVST